MRNWPRVGAGLEHITNDAALPARVGRLKLQRGHKCLREGPVGRPGREFVARDAVPPATAERNQLQRDDERLPEGPVVGESLKIAA